MLKLTYPTTGTFTVCGIYADGNAWTGTCYHKLPSDLENAFLEQFSSAHGVGDKAFDREWFEFSISGEHNRNIMKSAVDSVIDAMGSST